MFNDFVKSSHNLIDLLVIRGLALQGNKMSIGGLTLLTYSWDEGKTHPTELRKYFFSSLFYFITGVAVMRGN